MTRDKGKVAGIILAAGRSLRYQLPKPLLTWRGRTFIESVILCAMKGGLDQIIVVLGARVEQIRPVIADLPIQIIYNPDWKKGQSSSIQLALNFLPPEISAAIFLLVDQPQISSEIIQAEVDLFNQSNSAIIIPYVNGHRANPVLFSRKTFTSFRTISGDIGGRAIMNQFPVEKLYWEDESILLDVDTPEDYQRLLKFEQ